ncbi:hypothetical protein AVV27_gp42 [Achromobacter phage 83-24]|uniref:Uncharacterized protein n=1 Tax=Achromobacter phage 83-24 TaxID=1589747 RepID=A0A0B5A5B9_9CAUD|nr:hypothetical protein AVV27_gp42 [Achromobacter phage 83-24]AJD82875.1 hypothetical protein JWAP_00042 [Achromobacter phage 83-24]
MTEATKTEDTKTEKAPKAPVRNISAVARDAIRAGLSNADALAKVKAEFPDANTTVSSIAWYRNDLRKKGENFPSPERPKVEKQPKEKKAKAKKDDPKQELQAAATGDKAGADANAEFE